MFDKYILSSLKNGDEKALDELFDRYYVRLTRYALSRINDPMVAEEIVQDAYIYLWNKKDSITIETSLEAYLFRSVGNKCINYVKSRIHKINRLTTDTDDGHIIPGSMADLEGKELEQLIELALGSLPEQTALIYTFSRNADMTHAEIADELGVSRKTIEYHIGCALRRMRKVLQKYGYALALILLNMKIFYSGV